MLMGTPRGTVVFDLDGTLADTSGDLIAAANATLKEIGIENALSPVGDKLTAFAGGRAMLRLGLQRGGFAEDENKVDELFYPFLDHYDEDIDVFTRLYDGAVEAVSDVKSLGYATAICTNKPENLAIKLMKKLNFFDVFDGLVGADT